jgi:hypothetical protein
MTGERIDNLTEAKRLQREHGETDVAYFLPDVKAGPAVRHGITGTGMDGIDVDTDALRQAEGELAALHDDLMKHLRDAGELTGPLGDGGGPVTVPMRKAFKSRADVDGGVQAALVDYLEELVGVRLAILNTLADYEGVNSDMAARFNRQVAQFEEIA